MLKRAYKVGVEKVSLPFDFVHVHICNDSSDWFLENLLFLKKFIKEYKFFNSEVVKNMVFMLLSALFIYVLTKYL